MRHELAIGKPFADAIASGELSFHACRNDYGFQKGDLVRFEAYDGMTRDVFNGIRDKEYRITYVLSGHGLKDGYVAFGFDEVADDADVGESG